MKKIILSALLLLFIFVVFTGCRGGGVVFRPEERTVTMEQAVADLTGMNLAAEGYVRIAGRAEFYWNKLLSPEDFKGETVKAAPLYADIPASWALVESEGRGLPGTGFGTYRFTIRTGYSGEISLVLGNPNSAYRVWINDRLVGSVGTVGSNEAEAKPAKISRIYDLPSGGKDLVVTVQVSNFNYYMGGLTELVLVGARASLHDRHIRRMSLDLFLFGVFIVIALFNLAVFYIRRKEMAPLWFALFSILVAFRVLLTNEIYFTFLYPDMSYELMRKMEYVTVALGLPLFLSFLADLFPGDSDRRINRVFQILAAAYLIVIAVTPARTFSSLLPVCHVVYLVGGVYTTYIFIRAFVKKREGAVISMAGFLILFLTVINDILAANFIIQKYLILQVGFLFFIVAQSMGLTVGFSRAFSRVEGLSESLEKKVKERTRELEQERNRFKKRNELLEKELKLAKRIQQQLIPHPWPTGYISSLYKPMEQVGGDFYDFLKFRNSDRIGIFLSDVSGHGVPAAFITSMVKTIILQSGPKREDPAMLLTYLNDLLINQTGENFITAFYGIYDPATRNIIFANAGHHAPLIIRKDSVSTLSGKRSIPLAVVDNGTLERMNKVYSNNEAVLEKDSKILFYTDGLTEATRHDDTSVYFDEERLEQALLGQENRQCRDFIENIMNELVRFRGSERFDDDICMICLDVQ